MAPVGRFALAAVSVISSWWGGAAHAQAPGAAVRLIFTYGSEKQTWVEEATKAFNASPEATLDGGRIVVDVEKRAAGSNVVVGEALAGTTKAHIISPASRIFLEIGNGEAAERKQDPLVDLNAAQSLVNSPLVVATWPEIAKELDWDTKPPSWREAFRFAAEPEAWAPHGRKLGIRRFKFGHTHPSYSNSGLLAVLAEVYAGLDQFNPAKVNPPDLGGRPVEDYLKGVERGVIHYGESTGFFAQKMFDPKLGGPEFLSASILYENLVYEENKKARDKDPAAYAKSGPRIVAVYPAEGTFANDHPVCVVQRPWVTARHRAAARVYIDFLRSRKWQERARDLGFRPGTPGIPVADVLKPEFGVDANQFRDDQALGLPGYSVIKNLEPAWQRAKRPANIVLAIDISSSMKQEVKVINPETRSEESKTKLSLAKEAALGFVDQLSEGDSLTPIAFDHAAYFVLDEKKPTRGMDEKGKVEVKAALGRLRADGRTALYDAVDMGYTFLDEGGTQGNRGMVVLSDGEHDMEGEKADAKEAKRKAMLLKTFNNGEKDIFVFTIGYGIPGDPQVRLDEGVLKAIAEASKGKYYPAEPSKIGEVLRKIVTFF